MRPRSPGLRIVVMSKVFLSYSRGDKDFARRLAGELTEQGQDVWIDLDDIPPSAEWKSEIRSAIEAADNCGFVLSPGFVASEICAEELAHAIEHNKRIVPLLYRDVEPSSLDKALASLNWIVCRNEEGLSGVVTQVMAALTTDLEWVRAHTRLLVRALEWERADHNRSYLLRGDDLSTAEQSVQNASAKEPQPSESQSRYLNASRRAVTRRLRNTIASLAVALVVTAALGVTAWIQREAKEEQRLVAVARQAAARAELLLDQEPRLLQYSLFLAAVSLRDSPTLEGERALRRSVDLQPKAVMKLPLEGDAAVVVFESDNRFLVIGGELGIRVFDVSLDTEVLSLWDQYPVHLVAVSPDGRWVGAASGSEARIFAFDTGRVVARLPHRNTVRALVFSPDSASLATAAEGNEARVWVSETGTFSYQLDGAVSATLAFSPDGRWIAGGSIAGVEVWKAATGELVTEIQTAGGVGSLAFGPEGVQLAIGSATSSSGSNYYAAIMNVETGDVSTRVRHKNPVRTVAFSPDGDYVASGSDGFNLRVWDPRTGAVVAEMRHGDEIRKVAFNSSGSRVVTLSLDGTARVWQAATGDEVARVGHERGVADVDLSPDGRWLATASGNEVVVWEAAARGESHAWKLGTCAWLRSPSAMTAGR